MFDAALRPLVDRLTNPIGRWIAARGVSATAISLLGFFFGLLAAMMIVFGDMAAAAVLILLNRVCDGLDGAVARAVEPTDFGGFLDIVLDFIFYAMVPLSFAIYDPANALAAGFLIFSFLGTGVSFLAFAIMAEKRGFRDQKQGKKSFYYLGGLTEGGETIILLLALTLTPAWFVYYAVGFGILCWITTASRVYEARLLLDA